MASVRITIKTDNAAFHGDECDPDPMGWELTRILEVVCSRLRESPVDNIGPLRDANGNVVGKVEVIPDETAWGEMAEREQTEERASRANLRIALRTLVEAVECDEGLRSAMVGAGTVLKSEGV